MCVHHVCAWHLHRLEFMCVSVLTACMCVYHVCAWHLQKLEDGIEPSGTGTYEWFWITLWMLGIWIL